MLPSRPDLLEGRHWHGNCATMGTMKFDRGLLQRYSVALGLIWVTTLLLLGLKPFLVRGTVLLYIPAVMCSAWWGGLGPGLLATVLSVATTSFFFMDPTYSFAIQSGDD